MGRIAHGAAAAFDRVKRSIRITAMSIRCDGNRGTSRIAIDTYLAPRVLVEPR